MRNHQDVLKALLPSGAYDPNATNLNAELFAEGNALDFCMATANLLLAEMDPSTAQLSLYDWERNYGLPDQCVTVAQTIEQRKAAVTSKANSLGGQTPTYFIFVAESMGYSSVTITEFNVLTCNGNCNGAIYSPNALFVWQMNLPLTSGVFQSSCDSDCNSALQSCGNGAPAGKGCDEIQPTSNSCVARMRPRQNWLTTLTCRLSVPNDSSPH